MLFHSAIYKAVAEHVNKWVTALLLCSLLIWWWGWKAVFVCKHVQGQRCNYCKALERHRMLFFRVFLVSLSTLRIFIRTIENHTGLQSCPQISLLKLKIFSLTYTVCVPPCASYPGFEKSPLKAWNTQSWLLAFHQFQIKFLKLAVW